MGTGEQTNGLERFNERSYSGEGFTKGGCDAAGGKVDAATVVKDGSIFQYQVP